MIGIASRSAGVILLPKPGTSEYTILDVVEGVEKDPVEAQYLYSVARDWKEIEGADSDALLKTATCEYWLARTVSLLRLVIGGLEEPLEKRVLEHIEEALGSRVSSEKVLDHLLVAPLAHPQSPVAPAKHALSYGLSAVASILDELVDLQPLLHRLTDLWLSLEQESFSNIAESREMIWATLVEQCRMKLLLKANSGQGFSAKWNLLAFQFSDPHTRIGIRVLGDKLSSKLFPSKSRGERLTITPMKEFEAARSDEEKYGSDDHEAYARVAKQIVAIAQAVSKGQDAKAEKFLRELIQQQTSISGGENYAVKSLCNIAKRCADMFRTDFEVICLDKALELNPHDSWALIQQGDHLKRVGNYEEALKALRDAQQFGESTVGISSEADVYSHKGDFTRAIYTYKTIPNWSDDLVVRTAIADNLRKMGLFDEAKTDYLELIRLARQELTQDIKIETRVYAGLAEIAKKQGKLEDALNIYREILSRPQEEDRDRVFYRFGLCNVLKLMENFEEAYAIVDEVIEKYPFAIEGRFIRGSILGLIGKEGEGLEDLPESTGFRSWREWQRRYYRGLLLFKLHRYEDAKKNLVEELPKAIASEDEKAILRMGAALWFLGKDEIPKADEILSEIPDLNDCHVQYVSLVLKLHLATRKKDRATMDLLRDQIAGLQIVDPALDKAVVALRENNFSLALSCEANALLKLAA